MVAIREDLIRRDEEWWAYDADQGWVVLDKSLPQNKVTHRPEMYRFVRCSDWSVYTQGQLPWRYKRADNYLEQLPDRQAEQAMHELMQLQREFESRRYELV